MEDKSKTILRNIRNSLTDIFVGLARVLFFWIPGGDVSAGRALMAFHPIFMACAVFLFFIVEKKSPLRFIIAFAAILTSASQWFLGGCVVTRAERQLTGSKETIVDPFLTLAGIDVNRDTRIAATIACGTSITTIMIFMCLTDLLFA